MVDFFCSWSGGKDSSLALYKTLLHQDHRPCYLLTMMIENGERSRSHGIPRAILERQAACLEIPIRFCTTSWDSYTTNFINELNFFSEKQIHTGIFGDIDIENHREWVQNVCDTKKIIPILPLWKIERQTLLKDLLNLGFRAEIIAVKEEILPVSFLGKTINLELIEEFRKAGIDLCGEQGEYHTIVTDGPIFKQPLIIKHRNQVLRDGYWYSDIF